MEVSQLFLWALVLVVLTLVGTPLASWMFRRLPRGGALLGLPLALAWLILGSFWVGHWRFDAIGVGMVVLTLVVAAAIAYRRGPPIPREPLVLSIGLLLVAFAAMVWFRAGDPAVVPYAGEKFLDYSLVRTLLRTDVLPPPDPWFAGEPVRYYYGGHLLVATLATLTGTEAAYAYNLGFATVFAAAVVATYAVGSALAADLDASPSLGGAFAVGFVVLAGNFASAARLIGWLLPGPAAEAWISTFHLGDGGLLAGPDGFHYWHDSRVIPAEPEAFDYLINEFPFFAFVHGDLHAHLMALPFVVLLVGALFAWYRSPNGRERAMLLGVVIAPLLGLLVVVNTWSVITGVGLIAVTVALASTPPWGPPGRIVDGSLRVDRSLTRGIVGGGVAVVVAIGAMVLVLPYVLETRADASVGVLPHRTPFATAVLIYGGLLAAIVPGVIVAIKPPTGARAPVAVLAGLAILGVSAILGIATLVAFSFVVLLGIYLVAGRGHWTYALVLVVAGAGLAGSLEVLYVDDPASWERLNTVFKLGFEAWILFGLAAGAFLAKVVPRSWSYTVGAREVRFTGWTLAVVLLLALGLYATFALGAHLDSAREQPTLDATTYLHSGHADEAAAIEWLDAHAGTLTIAEAPGTDMYRWTSPASTFTGHQSVAGWRHAANYHDDHAGYAERVEALTVIFEGPPPERQAVIERYGVDLIYVGPAERGAYAVDLSDDPNLSVAYADRWVTIYAVDDA